MKNATINASYIKFILILSFVAYGLTLGFFLGKNSGLRRFVTIENTKPGGVVLIKQVKYPTPYTRQQARVGYNVDNPADYLFVNSGEIQESFASVVVKLTIVILLTVFLWRFDFEQPFQRKYLSQVRIIFGLIITAALLEWFAEAYTVSWVGGKLNSNHIADERYSYPIEFSHYTPVSVFIIIITVVVYLYSKAVQNQEELELTI